MPGLNLDTRTAQLLEEKLRRKYSAVSLFRPLANPDPLHSQEALFRCLEPRQHLVIGSNRAGKTVAMSVKYAAMALDQPVIFNNGEKVWQRRPDQKNRPLLMWLVGYDLKHVGQVIYPILRKPGAFKVIRDEATGCLRPFNPHSARDWERNDRGDVLQAPSLIPDEEVEDEVWYSKKGHELKSITLKNGTEIRAYSSTQEAAAGVKVDCIWINERMEQDAHYEEFLFRLLDLRGRIFWDVYSEKNANDIVLSLWDVAQQQMEQPEEERTVAAFQLLAGDNPFLPQKSRKEILESGVLSEEALLTRDKGQLLINHLRFYPEFSKQTHALLPIDPKDDDVLAAQVREHDAIPPHWTRYLALDPGTVRPFVLFAACPPPEEVGGHQYIVLYDELDARRMSAKPLAQKVAVKTQRQIFEQWVIDGHAARTTGMSYDRSVMTNYIEAFKAYGLKSMRGATFTPGIDKPLIRAGMVHAGLAEREKARPKIRVWLSRCPVLTQQMLARRRKKLPDGTLSDDPHENQPHDGSDCLEYLISLEIRYVDRGLSPVRPLNPFEDIAKRFGFQNRRQRDVVNVGPPEC